MLNQTSVLRHIERQLGFQFTDLELTHEEILETIRFDTIPVFSKYFPNVIKTKIGMDDLVEGYNNMYYILDKEDDPEIININRVVGFDAINGASTNDTVVYGNINPNAGMGGNMIDNQIMADIYSSNRNPATFFFHHPNKIELRPNYTTVNNFIVEVNAYHSDDFSSIPNRMRNEFLSLATYDVQISLYSIRHRFQNLSTPFGNMELDLDQLSDAQSKKDDLIERLHNNLLRTSLRKKVWLA